MLLSDCPTVFGFRRRESREDDDDNGEKMESELANLEGRSMVLGDGTELQGDETADQDYIRDTRHRWSPIFGTWRRVLDMQTGAGDSQSELQNGQKKDGMAGTSAIAHRRGKQLLRERDVEGSPKPVVLKETSLPDELVEKILAMIPFPEILKTRVLNKSWNTNFSASPDALVFQNQMRVSSAKWKHYCPIILNIEKESLVGYDREYGQWQDLPLRFQDLRNWFSTHLLRGAGSLMCGVFDLRNVFVTNMVTRTWKWLPSRPDMTCPSQIHLLSIGSEAYQVLLISKDERDRTKVFCQIYDSRMEAWTIKRSTVNTTLSNSSSVYLGGILYVMEYDPDDFHDVMKLLSYNVSDGTWTNLHHPFGSMLHEIETFELLVCQEHVMVVLHVHSNWRTSQNFSHNTLRNTLIVYKLDPDSLDIREVGRGPPEPMTATCTLFASDNECIYFGDPQVASNSVVELNVQNREWSCLPAPACADGSFKNKWATFSFQPGMNPLVSV